MGRTHFGFHRWLSQTAVPTPQALHGWWAEPSEHWHSQPRGWCLPRGQIVLQSETQRARSPEGQGFWVPPPADAGDSGAGSSLDDRGSSVPSLALTLREHWDGSATLSPWLRASASWPSDGHMKPQCHSPVSTQHPTGQMPKLALRTLVSWEQSDAEIQGGNSSMENSLLFLYPKPSKHPPARAPWCRERAGPWVQLSCEDVRHRLSVPPVLVFQRERRLGHGGLPTWTHLEAHTSHLSLCNDPLSCKMKLKSAVRQYFCY